MKAGVKITMIKQKRNRLKKLKMGLQKDSPVWEKFGASLFGKKVLLFLVFWMQIKGHVL